jgi:hypothetical protein
VPGPGGERVPHDALPADQVCARHWINLNPTG